MVGDNQLRDAQTKVRASIDSTFKERKVENRKEHKAEVREKDRVDHSTIVRPCVGEGRSGIFNQLWQHQCGLSCCHPFLQ